jgi:hippurate hydrolase
VTFDPNVAPATFNTPSLVSRVVPAMQAALGADKVMQTDPIMASEDFSEYGLVEPKIPSALFWVGGVNAAKFAATTDKNTLPSLHSALWAPDAEPAIKTGIVAMTSAALDLLAKK